MPKCCAIAHDRTATGAWVAHGTTSHHQPLLILRWNGRTGCCAAKVPSVSTSGIVIMSGPGDGWDRRSLDDDAGLERYQSAAARSSSPFRGVPCLGT